MRTGLRRQGPLAADISPRAAALIRARWPAWIALVQRLARDDHFWTAAGRVRSDKSWPASDASLARAARPYSRRHRLGFDLFVELFDLAASREGSARETFWLEMLAMCSVPVGPPDAAPPAGAPASVVQDRALTQFAHGAELVARRGSGRCLTCGHPLDHPRGVSATGRKVWRDHCRPCSADGRTRLNVNVDRLAIDLVLNEAGAVFLGEPSPAAGRRLKRKMPA